MKKMLLSNAINEAIAEEMRRDETVFCLGEDIGIEGGWGGAYTVTKGLSEEFGHDRILDTPISEAGFFGAAIGAALNGMRPVADLQYADFIFCMMDQLVNEAAKLCYMSGGEIKVPLVLRAPVGAVSRGAQHSQSIEAWCMHVPGIKVVCPATPYDAKGLVKAAIRDNNPVVILEHKLLYGKSGRRNEGIDLTFGTEVPEEDYIVEIGKANVVKEGTDITIVSSLYMLHKCYEAVQELDKQGINCELIDIRSILPMDYETVFASVKKTGKLLIVEEDTKTAGWGAELSARCAEDNFYSLKMPPKRLAALDTPTPCASHLEYAWLPQTETVIETVLKMLERK